MSELLASSFAAELQRIDELLGTRASGASPSVGLAKEIFRLASIHEAIGLKKSTLSLPKGELRDAPELAIGGYIVRSAPTTEAAEEWRDGLRRLSRRQAFTSDHQTFAFRPAELLGIAFGVATTEFEGSGVRKWLSKLLGDLPNQLTNPSIWNALWSAYAAKLFGVNWPIPVSSNLADWDVCDLSLALVLIRAKALSEVPGFGELSPRDLEKEILRRVLLSPIDEREIDRLAVCYVGIALSANAQLDQALSPIGALPGGTRRAISTIEMMCKKFEQYVRRLQDRYGGRPGFDVKDEYDVQDLIHALLVLHFDVVIPEDAVPARAGNKSRLDFLLKKERIVVETKMTRKGYGQSSIHDDLVADRDRYRTHPDCEMLLCFVYDPGHHFHNAPAFELDLNTDEGKPGLRAFVTPH